jgi:hypothetical protein
MNSTEKKLWAPKELAARWSMSRDAVLDLFHTGKITAEIAEKPVYRFDLETVEKQLKERAEKKGKPTP